MTLISINFKKEDYIHMRMTKRALAFLLAALTALTMGTVFGTAALADDSFSFDSATVPASVYSTDPAAAANQAALSVATTSPGADVYDVTLTASAPLAAFDDGVSGSHQWAYVVLNFSGITSDVTYSDGTNPDQTWAPADWAGDGVCPDNGLLIAIPTDQIGGQPMTVTLTDSLDLPTTLTFNITFVPYTAPVVLNDAYIGNTAATPAFGRAIAMPYDLSSRAAIPVSVTLNGHVLTQVLLNGAYLTYGTDYSFDPVTNVCTVNASALAGLSTSLPSTLRFIYNSGNASVLTLNVTDSHTAAAMTLDTADHYAYINGYPDGTVAPNGTMTRAEAAEVFFRVTLDPDKNTPLTDAFADVPGDAWYAQAVNYLAAKGIITGRDAATFDPGAPISRREFAAMAARYTQLIPGTTQVFSDVSTGDWAYNYINTAYANNWVVGYQDGTFQPDQPITRGEVVTVVNRMLGRTNDGSVIPAAYDNYYTDLTPASPYFGALIEASVGHTYSTGADGSETGWTADPAIVPAY